MTENNLPLRPLTLLPLFFLAAAIFLAPAWAQEEIDPAVISLGDNLFRMTSPNGLRTNIAVLTGAGGILLLDTGQRDNGRNLKAAIDKLGKGKVKYIINSHPHSDHISGNTFFPKEAQIINHGNLEQMVARKILSPGKGPLKGKNGKIFPAYFVMNFNGEEIRIIPAGGTHTEDDLIVYFTRAGVVHMGDLLLSQAFPAVSSKIPRYLEILETALDVFPVNTLFVSGHGRDSSHGAFKKYREMLLKTIQIVKKAKSAGKSLDEMHSGKILKDFEFRDNFLNSLNSGKWTKVIYNNY